MAAFASSNLGDVSPNIKGPKCINSGKSCDDVSSSCDGQAKLCIASGPGDNMFESTEIIAQRLYRKAKVNTFGELFLLLLSLSRQMAHVMRVWVGFMFAVITSQT